MISRALIINVTFASLAIIAMANVAAIAQTGKSVVIGSMVDRPNALLVLNPANGDQGVLVPQLTTSQRLSMRPTSPKEDGLLLFDITEKSFYFWRDNDWVKGLGDPTISGAVSGDLTGKYPSPSVTKLQGNAIAPGSLSAADAGKLLVWNGTQWVPQVVRGIMTPVSQHVMIDPSEFTNLRRGDKKDKDNIIMFDDNSTYVTTIKKNEGPQIIAPLQLPDGATIEEVTLYYMDREASDIVFNVYRKSPTGSNETVINSWSSSGNSGTIRTSVHTPIPGADVVDNSNYSYRILVTLDQSNDVITSNDANLRVYAVKVKYMP